MPYGLLANLTACLHAAFVLFVVCGGFAVLKWPRLIWLHLPAVAWGVVVEFAGWPCPLTPLEHWLREQAGGAGDQTDFVARSLLSILYPEGLTRETQVVLGVLVLAINLAVYGRLWRLSRLR